MQVRGGTLQRLGPGQVFYESFEDVHTVSRSARKIKPAKFVVFSSRMKEHRFSLPFPVFGFLGGRCRIFAGILGA